MGSYGEQVREAAAKLLEQFWDGATWMTVERDEFAKLIASVRAMPLPEAPKDEPIVTEEMARRALLAWCQIPPSHEEAFWAARKQSDVFDGTLDSWKRALAAGWRRNP